MISHSNAAIERLFSLVNKNKSESWESNPLDQDKTLTSILAVTLDYPETSSALCDEFQLDKGLLGMAKNTVVNYNKENSN